MNIALLGYGKMGHEVERVAIERGHDITARFDFDNPVSSLTDPAVSFDTIDCCIDFSFPTAVPANVRIVTSLGVPIVVGTTGWAAELEVLTEHVRKFNGALLHSSNFSIGALLFTRLVSEAAKIMAASPEYDVAVHEVHHRMKKDAPSGTALTVAKEILASYPAKKKIVTSLQNRQIEAEELLISSSRVGAVTGIHTIQFDSMADTIELTHTAHSRRGFALGAVIAAEWLAGKKGVFTMNDVLRT